MRLKRRHLLYGGIALATAAAGLFAVQSASAELPIPIDQPTQFRAFSLQPDACLDADDNSLTRTNTKVQIFRCHGGSNQNWIIQPAGSGSEFTIVNEAAQDKCLDIDREGLGTTIQLNPCDGGASQLWEIPAGGSDTNLLANRAGNDALAAQGLNSRVLLAHATSIQVFGEAGRFLRGGVEAVAQPVDNPQPAIASWVFVV